MLDTRVPQRVTSAMSVCIGLIAAHIGAANAGAPTNPNHSGHFMALDSLDGIEIKAPSEIGSRPVKVQADVAAYDGRRALRLVSDDSTMMDSSGPSGGELLAVAKDADFKDGIIRTRRRPTPPQPYRTIHFLSGFSMGCEAISASCRYRGATRRSPISPDATRTFQWRARNVSFACRPLQSQA
jgi:hypothetical protein